MLLSRAWTLAWAPALLLCLALPLQAGEAPAADAAPVDSQDVGAEPARRGSLEVIVGLYMNDDHGDGNPFLDEKETVIEPVVVFDLNVTDDLAITITGSYDFVSSASIDRLSRYPEQSGASGDNYIGGDLAARYSITSDVRVSAHAGYSTEYDYDSFGTGGTLSVDLFQKQTTLELGLNAYFDTVRIIRFNGAENEGDDDRTSITLSLSWYQVLSPTLHASFGYSFTSQSGFLETAYNGVVLEDGSDPPNPLLDNNARGVEVAEELPDTRLRHALFAEIRKYFEGGTSISLWGRFYADDWGVVSATFEVRAYQWIVDDVLRLRVRYRYYVQSAADDFDEHFYVPPAQRAAFVATAERTQDSDLGDFDSHGVGIQLVWRFYGRNQLTLGGDYVLRSDGIDQLTGIIGYQLEF